MEAVGWETTACKREITVLHLVIPHFLLNVWKEKWPVTWELMEAVGGEITACQKALSVLHLVILHFLLNVWREKWPVTWDLRLAAGMVTPACQKDQSVQWRATTLLQLSAHHLRPGDKK